ncbi:thioesterase II family protein [Streptomyces sp. NPDC053474]|uniref:thioesterase II family protein n=1 Tax=Streptomyces sp. NPDC053474 TaxID=3365704 RepID=UPI0037D48E1A
MTAPDDPGLWFHRAPGPPRTPRLRLVCFPHAGGTARLFDGWRHRLPTTVEVVAVRYPGRQERLDEPCVESMTELADRITGALAGYDDVPLALFGHSMGASVAYEVARRLEAGAGPAPVHLMVSARAAPGHGGRTTLHRAADEVLLAAVRRLGTLGGVDPFAEPELRELLLPVLRSDYRLVETYAPAAEAAPLHAPITAYLGDRDPGCSGDRVRAWAGFTTGDFALRAFSGDHFYLAPREAELTSDIAERLAPAPVATARGTTAT